jgi:hypothetical protein
MNYLFWALLGFRVGTALTVKAMSHDDNQKPDKS